MVAWVGYDVSLRQVSQASLPGVVEPAAFGRKEQQAYRGSPGPVRPGSECENGIAGCIAFGERVMSLPHNDLHSRIGWGRERPDNLVAQLSQASGGRGKV
jgi:hypothetical protein